MAVATSTVIAAAALATTAVAAYQQQQAAEDVADARGEARDISGAQQQIQQRRATRQSIREERIRRARILQASANTGVAGSSSQFGSTGALSTITAGNFAAGRSGAAAARGISQANQGAVDAQTRGQMWGAIGQVGSAAFQGAGGFGTIFSGAGSSGGGQPISGGFSSQIFTGGPRG